MSENIYYQKIITIFFTAATVKVSFIRNDLFNTFKNFKTQKLQMTNLI